MVASGDMSGMIKVWKVETKEEIWSFEVGDLEVRASALHQPECVLVCLVCASVSTCVKCFTGAKGIYEEIRG